MPLYKLFLVFGSDKLQDTLFHPEQWTATKPICMIYKLVLSIDFCRLETSLKYQLSPTLVKCFMLYFTILFSTNMSAFFKLNILSPWIFPLTLSVLKDYLLRNIARFSLHPVLVFVLSSEDSRTRVIMFQLGRPWRSAFGLNLLFAVLTQFTSLLESEKSAERSLSFEWKQSDQMPN